MRILILSQQLSAFRSGVGTYTHSLITGLRDQGHHITAVVPAKESLELPGVTVIPLSQFRFDPTPGGWLSLGISFSRFLSKRGQDFDLAHFTDSREAWFIRKPFIPLTGMVNDSYAVDWAETNFPRHLFEDRTQRGLYYLFLRKIEQYTYPRLKALITNSDYTRRRLIDHYRIAPSKVRVIYIGLPVERHISKIDLEGSPSLLFVGGNFHRKGLPLLIKAVSHLRFQYPHICVHVVGRDRNENRISALACRFGISRNIKFHGRQPHKKVLEMMAGASAFVMPSLTEGFGLVYLEAMRMGTPVVATSIGGAKEVFKNMKDVIFVDPQDEKGLHVAIKKIISREETIPSLRQSVKVIAKHFTVETMAKETVHFFESVLK